MNIFSNLTPFEAVQSLVQEFGLSAFPLRPGDKIPPEGFSWKEYQLTAPSDEKLDELNETYPNANWAIPLGERWDIVVVDCDDEEALKWAEKTFVHTPWRVRTGKGWHLYYHYPRGTKVRSENLRASKGVNAEIKADGVYVVAPQSVHKNGNRYTLETEGAEWEWVPEFGCLPSETAIDPTIDLSSVEACFSEVTTGERNNFLARYAGRLFAAGLPLEQVMERVKAKNADLCTPPLPPREVMAVVGSIYRTHQRNHPAPADAPDQAVNMDGVEWADSGTIDRPWPEDILHPGGLLEEIMNYTTVSSIRTRPVYSLAGAIVLLGALAGQRIKGETNLTTNMYCAVLGKSASGKDAPKRAVVRLLGKVAINCLGDSDVASDSAIVTHLAKYGFQRACYVFDELGVFLKACKNPNSPRAGVAKLLTELFSRYDTPYTKGYADEDNVKTLWWQSLSLLGMSVPEEFWASVQDGEATNGFLARLLVFEDAGDPAPRNPSPRTDPPEELLAALRDVWEIDGGEREPETDEKGVTALDCIAKPNLVAMTAEARAFHDAQADEADRLAIEKGDGKAGPAASSIYGRLPEHALKLGLIYAVSRLGGGVVSGMVDLEDIQKAWRLARELADRLVTKLETAIHASDFERLCIMAEEAIRKYVKFETARKRPKPGAPRSAIEKALPVPPRVVKEVLDKMVAMNRLRLHAGWKKTENSRRPLDLYRIVREIEEDADGE